MPVAELPVVKNSPTLRPPWWIRPGNDDAVKRKSMYNLCAVLDSEISNKGSAELAVLHLFNTYDLDLDDLQRLLLGLYSSLNAS